MFEVDSMSRSNHLMSNHYLVKDLKKIFKNQWNLFSTDRPAPAPIDCLNLKKTIAVSCGVVHSAVLTKVQNFFYTIFLNHFWGIKLYRNAVTEFQLQTSLWPLNTIAGCKTKKKKKHTHFSFGEEGFRWAERGRLWGVISAGIKPGEATDISHEVTQCLPSAIKYRHELTWTANGDNFFSKVSNCRHVHVTRYVYVVFTSCNVALTRHLSVRL